MALTLNSRPPRKNAQFRLCDAALEAIDTLQAHYGNGHSRSDIVEAALMFAVSAVTETETEKKKGA